MIDGYKIWGAELKLGWQKHGSHILTGGGTALMLVGSILSARRGMSDEVQQAIAEAEAVIAEVKADQAKEAVNAPDISVPETKSITKSKKFKLAKAKARKVWKVGKHFWKEAAVEAVGVAMITAGKCMDESIKTGLATACAAGAAEFAAYRANVIADQGPEKDLEYLTTKRVKGASKVKMNDGTIIESTDENNSDVTVRADPSAFKFWFSPETCPSLYTDNLDLTKLNLEWVENNLTRMLRMNGHLYLNDMRREFGGLTPKKMDVPLGGIFGLTCDRTKLETLKHVDLGWRNDADFMDGRKVGVWIIFPCDPEPIVSKVNPKMLVIEDPVR